MNKCKRCLAEWKSRFKSVPVQCPRCKSPFWQTERKKEFNQTTGETTTKEAKDLLFNITKVKK